MREQTQIIEELQQRLSKVEAEQHHFKELYRIADIEVDTLRVEQTRLREALQQILDCSVSLKASAIARAALFSAPTPETTP